jgi:outer membrane protein TolC
MGNKKKAKKAYKRAVKAVDKAVRTAENADDAARRRLTKLAERLAEYEPTHPNAPIDLTPPLPRAGGKRA